MFLLKIHSTWIGVRAVLFVSLQSLFVIVSSSVCRVYSSYSLNVGCLVFVVVDIDISLAVVLQTQDNLVMFSLEHIFEYSVL